MNNFICEMKILYIICFSYMVISYMELLNFTLEMDFIYEITFSYMK